MGAKRQEADEDMLPRRPGRPDGYCDFHDPVWKEMKGGSVDAVFQVCSRLRVQKGGEIDGAGGYEVVPTNLIVSSLKQEALELKEDHTRTLVGSRSG